MRPVWDSPEFVHCFIRGDAEALEAIYLEYVDLLDHVLATGFLTRNGCLVPGVRNRETRADLLQEVFAKAFADRARRSFACGADYRPYIATICRNVLVDAHRHRGRERALFSEALRGDEPVQQVDEPLLPTHAWEGMVEAYVTRLSSPLREVHRLRFVEGKSQRHAAIVLGMTRQNLRTLEARLKRELRDRLLPVVCSSVELPRPPCRPRSPTLATS
jgi:RNA polymerase sigma factor (sigma-70 family)